MADSVRRIEYYYTTVSNRAGAGIKVFNALKSEGVSLFALNGFPTGVQSAQLDLVPFDPGALRAAAKNARIKLTGPKTAFLIEGEDRAGAVADIVSRLTQARINITAMQAIATGDAHYKAILWVKPRKIDKAAQALGVS